MVDVKPFWGSWPTTQPEPEGQKRVENALNARLSRKQGEGSALDGSPVVAVGNVVAVADDAALGSASVGSPLVFGLAFGAGMFFLSMDASGPMAVKADGKGLSVTALALLYSRP